MVIFFSMPIAVSKNTPPPTPIFYDLRSNFILVFIATSQFYYSGNGMSLKNIYQFYIAQVKNNELKSSKYFMIMYSSFRAYVIFTASQFTFYDVPGELLRATYVFVRSKKIISGTYTVTVKNLALVLIIIWSEILKYNS